MPTPILTFNPTMTAPLGSAYTVLDATATVNDGGNVLGAIRVTLGSGVGSLGVVIGGTLTTTGTIGSISYLYEPTKRLLSLTSATATGADFTQILRLVGYNQGTGGIDATQSICINLGIPIYSTETGHYYEKIPFLTGPVAANTEANAKNFFGLPGYLPTLTSAIENKFLVDRFQSPPQEEIWIGGSRAGTLGNEVWSWNAGPEAGQVFWNGVANGSAPPGRYTNWRATNPNTESYLAFVGGLWASLPGFSLPYFIEYSTVSGVGDDGLSGTRSVFIVTVGNSAEIAALIQASTPIQVSLVNGAVTSMIGVALAGISIGASNGTHIQVSINLGTTNAGKRRQARGFRVIGGSERELIATRTQVGEVYTFVFLKTVDGSTSVNLLLN